MTPEIIAVVTVFLALTLVAIGVHVCVSLIATSGFALLLIFGDVNRALSMLGSAPFYSVFSYEFAVIPLFVLMGLFANASGASKELYDGGFTLFGRVKGGLAVVTVLSNAVFAAVTGVSIASAAVFGKIAVPEMLRYGYSMKFSTGCVAGTSALGMLIPPSLLFIVYGMLSGISIGTMFIAGIVPGIVLAAAYSLVLVFMAYATPRLLGNPQVTEATSLRDKVRAIAGMSWIAALIVLVLGGIYAGIFTPTEAGAVGCIGSLFLMIIKGRLTVSNVKYALKEAGKTTAAVFLLIIAAQIFSRMLTLSGLVDLVSHSLVGLAFHPMLILAMMLIVLMLLGTFLDVVSILLISMPIMLPAASNLGFNLIWFGVLVTLSIQTGLITPPFGMSVFVVKGAVGDDVSVEEVFAGALPFLLILLGTIVVLSAFPMLSTWLPALM